ncbi:MAG: hypothetical protein WCR63_04690 [Bacilli bacterium]
MEEKNEVEQLRKKALQNQQEKISKIEREKLERTGYDYKKLLKQKNTVFYWTIAVLLVIEVALFFTFIFSPSLKDFSLYAKISIPIIIVFELIGMRIFTVPNLKVIKMSDYEAGKEKQRLDKEEEENIRKRNQNRYRD